MRGCCSVWSVVLACCFTTPGFAGVVVVAPGGSVQAAIQAANDGDVVLVHATTSSGFTIVNKSLSVVTEPSSWLSLTGPVVVRNLQADKRVLLRGLRNTHSASSILYEPLTCADCAGHVRVEGCEITPANLGVWSFSAATVVNCADIEFAHCILRASPASEDEAYPGLLVTSSTIAVHSCQITGARGVNGFYDLGMPTGGGWGGDAITCLESSTLFTSGSVLTGGDGGNGLNGTCTGSPYAIATAGGRGGNGIACYGTAGTVRWIDAQFVGGQGGHNGTCPGQSPSDAADGAGILPGSSSVTTIPGTARRLDVAPVAREGQVQRLHFEGLPGDLVFLALSPSMLQSYEPRLHGVLLVAPPFPRFYIAFIPGLGGLDFDIVVPELGTGVEERVQQIQGILIDPGGERWTTDASTLVWLDSAF